MRSTRGFLILVLFLLSACSGLGSGSAGPPDAHRYYIGKEGVKLDFLPDAPTKAIYENSPFPVVATLHNKGAIDVPFREDGMEPLPASLSVNFDPYYIKEADQWEYYTNNEETGDVISRISIFGSSERFPGGQELTYTLPLTTKKVVGQRESPNTQLYTNLCYPYITRLQTDVCMDTNSRDSRNLRKQVCTAKDLSFGSGQGAPVEITKVEVQMVPVGYEGYLTRPRFVIHVKNSGPGTVVRAIEPDNHDTNLCSYTDDRRALATAFVKAYFANIELECKPNPFKLVLDEAKFYCIVSEEQLGENLPLFGSQANFFTTLNVNLYYTYGVSVSRDMEIERLFLDDFPAAYRSYNEGACFPWEMRSSEVIESYVEGRDLFSGAGDARIVWPAEQNLITSCVGARGSANHEGLDIETGTGEPVKAAAEGVVFKVNIGSTGFGNSIVLEHPGGIYTRYSHLDTIDVSLTDRVAPGDVIGTSGSTGNTRGPAGGDHLDFMVYTSPALSTFYNPLCLYDQSFVSTLRVWSGASACHTKYGGTGNRFDQFSGPLKADCDAFRDSADLGITTTRPDVRPSIEIDACVVKCGQAPGTEGFTCSCSLKECGALIELDRNRCTTAEMCPPGINVCCNKFECSDFKSRNSCIDNKGKLDCVWCEGNNECSNSCSECGYPSEESRKVCEVLPGGVPEGAVPGVAPAPVDPTGAFNPGNVEEIGGVWRCTDPDNPALNRRAIRQAASESRGSTRVTVPEYIALAVAEHETRARPFYHCESDGTVTENSLGAVGVMQVTHSSAYGDGTWPGYCPGMNIYDKMDNVRCGVRILQYKHQDYNTPSKYEAWVRSSCGVASRVSDYLEYRNDEWKRAVRGYNGLGCIPPNADLTYVDEVFKLVPKWR